jgi:hypothetical protein
VAMDIFRFEIVSGDPPMTCKVMLVFVLIRELDDNFFFLQMVHSDETTDFKFIVEHMEEGKLLFVKCIIIIRILYKLLDFDVQASVNGLTWNIHT